LVRQYAAPDLVRQVYFLPPPRALIGGRQKFPVSLGFAAIVLFDSQGLCVQNRSKSHVITRTYTRAPQWLGLQGLPKRNILVTETTKPALAGFEAAWRRRQALHAKVSGNLV
jgi:hypothetical protein